MAALPSLPNPDIKTRVASTATRIERIRGTRRTGKSRTSLDNLQMTWTLTQADYAAFMAFYNDTINKGADFFEMNIWSGDNYFLQSVRFVKPIQERDAYPLMILSGELEAYDRIVADSATVDAALGV